MAWSSGTYTKGNAATNGWTGDATNGIGIEAGRHDTQDDDFATGINSCLAKDGSNQMAGNLNFGGNLPSNVGAGTAAAPAYCAGNDVDTGMFSPGANTLALSTGGAEHRRIGSTGQELIGITSARTNLFAGGVTSIEQREHVISGTTRAVSQVWNSNDSQGGYNIIGKTRGTATGSNTVVQANDQLGGISFQGADGTNMIEAARIQAFSAATPGTNDMPGLLVFSTTADGAASVTERLRITQDGNIGINSTTPLEKLQIGTVSSVTPSDSSGSAGTIVGFNTYYNAGLKALTTGGRAVIVELGNAGGLLKSSTGTQTAGSALTTFNTYMEWGGFSDIVQFSTAGVNRVRITAAGETLTGGTTDNGAYNLQCNGTGVWGAGAYVNGSDARIKNNITAIDSTLDIINKLKPVTYAYKPEWSKDQSIQPGFIAQEVEEALQGTPYVEGVVQRGYEYMALAYQNFVPLLVKATQELSAKVETLEARIAELENA